jgi:hypothetical protein
VIGRRPGVADHLIEADGPRFRPNKGRFLPSPLPEATVRRQAEIRPPANEGDGRWPEPKRVLESESPVGADEVLRLLPTSWHRAAASTRHLLILGPAAFGDPSWKAW